MLLLSINIDENFVYEVNYLVKSNYFSRIYNERLKFHNENGNAVKLKNNMFKYLQSCAEQQHVSMR